MTMFLDLSQPVHAVMFGSVHQPHGNWHAGRTLSDALLIYLTEGAVRMAVGGETCALTAGQFLLIPPKTPYRPMESDGCAYYFFHISASECAGAPFDVHMSENKALPAGDFAWFFSCAAPQAVELETRPVSAADPAIPALMQRAAALRIDRAPHELLLMDTLLRELLIRISRTFRADRAISPKLHRMLQFVRAHYAEPIRLPDLARAAGVSDSYAARLFREQLHTRSSDYVNRVRLAAACELLVNSTLSVGEIADRVGFSDIYYFSRTFRAQYHVPPRGFRQRSSATV